MAGDMKSEVEMNAMANKAGMGSEKMMMKMSEMTKMVNAKKSMMSSSEMKAMMGHMDEMIQMMGKMK